MTLAGPSLPTPRLLLDADITERNIARMTDLIVRQHGRALRPHFKTSKMLEVARLQQRGGATGFTCATAAEVRALVDAGFTDLYWAHIPAGEARVRATLEFNQQAAVAVAIDSFEVAVPLDRAASQSKQQIPYLIEIDTGLGRAGVAGVNSALALAHKLQPLTQLRCVGIFTHEGQLYSIRDPKERARVGREVGGQMVAIATALREHGFPVPTVSVGCTPAAASAPLIAGVTEARPGTYVFQDGNQLYLGVATPEDCAVCVLSRVVSRPRPGTAIIDAGLKAMSSDRSLSGKGFGQVIGHPSVEFLTAYEEHGLLTGPGADFLQLGQTVTILPNHVCGTVNMWSSALIVRHGDIIDEWRTVARH